MLINLVTGIYTGFIMCHNEEIEGVLKSRSSWILVKS